MFCFVLPEPFYTILFITSQTDAKPCFFPAFEPRNSLVDCSGRLFYESG